MMEAEKELGLGSVVVHLPTLQMSQEADSADFNQRQKPAQSTDPYSLGRVARTKESMASKRPSSFSTCRVTRTAL